MSSPKEKKQTAMLAAIVCAILAVVLIQYLPGYSIAALMAEKELNEIELDNVVSQLTRYKKALAHEKHDKEQAELDKKALEEMETHVRELDPRFWFLRVFDEEGQKLFGVRASKTAQVDSKPTPEGMRLPQRDVYSYKVTVDGSFTQIGNFVAHLENKYPLLAVRSLSLKSGSPDGSVCTAVTSSRCRRCRRFPNRCSRARDATRLCRLAATAPSRRRRR
jgi:hypothetical protein